ncbi:MAG: hypothetical protein AA908_09905 [Chlorobi bacterium NICIL-2]|nr:MAG: hypothetical protein AA908_09905 [Chlorobi bacterium NICIL-2]
MNQCEKNRNGSHGNRHKRFFTHGWSFAFVRLRFFLESADLLGSLQPGISHKNPSAPKSTAPSAGKTDFIHTVKIDNMSARANISPANQKYAYADFPVQRQCIRQIRVEF